MAATIRLAEQTDAMAIARVHVDAWRDTYPNLISADYLAEKMNLGRTTAYWARCLRDNGGREQIYVALASRSEVIGFAAFGPSREAMFPTDSELYAIYLDIDLHGQGIGRQLCRTVARHLIKIGAKSLCVEVLEGNPTRFFYEAMGAVRVALKTHRFEGEVLPSVLYRWSDLNALASTKYQNG